MHLVQLFHCMKGQHVRSRRRARFVNGTRESVCRGCGRRMIQEEDAGYGWRLANDSDPLPENLSAH